MERTATKQKPALPFPKRERQRRFALCHRTRYPGRQLHAPPIVRHFLGQEAAQTPQAMQVSGSRRQVLVARSTAMACWGHFLAQRVQ